MEDRKAHVVGSALDDLAIGGVGECSGAVSTLACRGMSFRNHAMHMKHLQSSPLPLQDPSPPM
jgi:hypothetical protein